MTWTQKESSPPRAATHAHTRNPPPPPTTHTHPYTTTTSEEEYQHRPLLSLPTGIPATHTSQLHPSPPPPRLLAKSPNCIYIFGRFFGPVLNQSWISPFLQDPPPSHPCLTPERVMCRSSSPPPPEPVAVLRQCCFRKHAWARLSENGSAVRGEVSLSLSISLFLFLLLIQLQDVFSGKKKHTPLQTPRACCSRVRGRSFFLQAKKCYLFFVPPPPPLFL